MAQGLDPLTLPPPNTALTMILLLNCLVTQDVFSIYDRGQLRTHHKLEIFKYMLASLSEIPFEQAFINVSVAEEFRDEENALFDFMASLFPQAHIRRKRLEKYGDWQQFIHENHLVRDARKPVLVACNDDHIFIDKDVFTLERLLSVFQGITEVEQYVSLVYSHWFEAQRYHGQFDTLIYMEDCRVCLKPAVHDGIQIISAGLLKKWFFEDTADYPADKTVRRTEDLKIDDLPIFTIIPHTELFRHFDGYSHAGVSIVDCAPLTIPPGFFSRALKIHFCNRISAKECHRLMALGYTICSPETALCSPVFAPDPVYHFTPDNLPLFWQKQIPQFSYADHDSVPSQNALACASAIQNLPLFDPGHPSRYQFRKTQGLTQLCRKDLFHPGMPDIGFHKYPQPSKKPALILLEDSHLIDKKTLSAALLAHVDSPSYCSFEVHLILIIRTHELFKGQVSIVLNKYIGEAHPQIHAAISLNCIEDFCLEDIQALIRTYYAGRDVVICHNTDAETTIPLASELFGAQRDVFFEHSPSPSILYAGSSEDQIRQNYLLVGNTRQFGKKEIMIKSKGNIVRSLMQEITVQHDIGYRCFDLMQPDA